MCIRDRVSTQSTWGKSGRLTKLRRIFFVSSEMAQTGEKKLLKPEKNTIQISSRRDVKFYIFLSKIFLQTFNDVELHALGEAMSLSVRVAEQLQRHGYVTITGIQTFPFDPEHDTVGNNQRRGGNPQERRGRRLKMVIKVTKTDRFNELTKSFGANRQQTQKGNTTDSLRECW
eukprot:TRINITY_DN861_c0_g1_i1.p1 TRINITY_DN861_c0_g1~~TRINITY_DN861_c0_g1_i1.p1  ORF type:complete len:173 (-),score=66.71 TRINITY_DN861_c0_g1_i1:280-798(-)